MVIATVGGVWGVEGGRGGKGLKGSRSALWTNYQIPRLLYFDTLSTSGSFQLLFYIHLGSVTSP